MRVILYFIFSYTLCFSLKVVSQTYPSVFVNPFIGTGGAGHTFPGPVLPFGMVQLSPDTRIDGSWEGCSGYHYSDSVIYGFSHTHLSGTGVSDYGDILLMPTTGKPSMLNSDYKSKFSHKKEHAKAGYYQVELLDDTINAELTTTERVGVHRYTFPKTKKANIVIDLLHRDQTLHSDLKIMDSVTLVGYRVSNAWATEQHIYFVVKFSKPFINSSVVKSSSTHSITNGGFFQFDASNGEPIIVKVAISQTSIDGAEKNLNAEATHFDFDSYKNSAISIWDKQLSKIEASTPEKEKLETFYSALYHCMIHPSMSGDVDGNYRGRDQKIHQAKNFVPYTVFSLWDTFRALHPLFTIIEKKRTMDFIHTFLNQYNEGGRLPMWELSANETNCMIGFHSASVITDAWMKNMIHSDSLGMYKALVSASNYNKLGYPAFNQQNYLQLEDESESVSKTLEYAYDNWCVAQVAKKMNNKSDFDLFMKRAQGYKNLFNQQSGFFQPKKNGNWLADFNPKEVNNHYTEANGWQYNFFVPHDLDGFINIMGGHKSMETKLDELFNTSSDLNGRTQADITGLIGQYAHGNEPSHHMAFLYNYVGRPYKTQEITHKILNEFYKNTPDGLIGNEDCGQMSAWYVLTSMGFYQVCPGYPEFTITTPLFESIKINLENHKSVDIRTSGFKSGLKYVRVFSLNGKRKDNNSFLYSDIEQGAVLNYDLQSTKPMTKSSNYKPSTLPHTKINSSDIVIAPYFSRLGRDKNTSDTISIYGYNKDEIIYYTLNGDEPTQHAIRYHKPFLLKDASIVKAKAYTVMDSSSTSKTIIYKKPNDWKIKLFCKYNKQYSAGSDEGIIDGVKGSLNWRAGEWQGYQSQDFEAIIDLGKKQSIQSISSHYLQDTRSWILFPTEVDYYISDNGLDFNFYGHCANTILADDYEVQVKPFLSINSTLPSAQYIKIKAKNYGKLPDWHQGKGEDAFIFIDEIEIK